MAHIEKRLEEKDQLLRKRMLVDHLQHPRRVLLGCSVLHCHMNPDQTFLASRSEGHSEFSCPAHPQCAMFDV